tara:strand:- start:357 stop:863 length:507 start_codon:yes stop_codon:yes gene_type:complete
MKNHNYGKGFIDISGWSKNDKTEVDWWTPPEVFEKLGLQFDLDPAAPQGGVPWLPTNNYYTKEDNGLEKDWYGNVWLNPPYGRFTGSWLDKFIEHGNGIALVFARTETIWFHKYALQADSLLFTKGRFKFAKNGVQKDYASIGSLFIACGNQNSQALKNSGMGWYVEL